MAHPADGAPWPRAAATRIASALLALWIAGPTLAQACTACDGSGLVPCRTCAGVETGTIACSVAVTCARCQGMLATPCAECSAGAAELKRRRDLVQQFLAERRARLKESGVEERSVLQCRTAHFDLLFAPGRIEGCRETDLHLQMHLFAARLEALQARFAAVLGTPAPGTRIQVAIVKDERNAHRLCLSLTGVEAQTALCDWRVTKTSAKLGAMDVGPLADQERELAVWGTDTVFRFPAMPPGLVPGRGRT